MYLVGFIEIFESGITKTQSIADQWDVVWEQVFGLADSAVGGTLLYNVLVQIAHVFAVGCVVVLAFELFSQLNERRYDVLLNFVWALAISALLANNGKLLIGFSLTLRDFIALLNQQVLDYAVAGASLQDNFEKFQQAMAGRVIAANYFQHCEYMVGEGQKQCLAEVAGGLNVALQNMQASGNNSPSLDWLLTLVQRLLPADPITGAVQNSGGADALNADLGSIQAGLGSLFLPQWESAVFSILSGFMEAYQHFLELSLVLTALMGPLAVGGSLLPGGAKPLFAWLTGFFSIGFAKLAFNIMAGLSAVAAASAEQLPDQLPLYAIFGIFRN